VPLGYVGTHGRAERAVSGGFGNVWTTMNYVDVAPGTYLVSTHLAWYGNGPSGVTPGTLSCRILPQTQELYLFSVVFERGEEIKSLGNGGLDRLVPMPSGGRIELSCRSMEWYARVQSAQLTATQVR
jgi:hypothetical protein